MLSFQGISKWYGQKQVLKNVSFDVPYGAVTGFVGPNGSGKTTTLRIAMGLTTPATGQVTIDGKSLAHYPKAATKIAAVLDQQSFHPGRSVRATLRALAATQGLSAQRVEEVLELVGLTNIAKQRVSTLSLGMHQRMGIAAALMPDPGILLFDEPLNGLDPEGVRWVRSLCHSLANEGRAILVSSHLLSEVAQTADLVVVLGRGSVLATDTIAHFTSSCDKQEVEVASPDQAALAAMLRGSNATPTRSGSLLVSGLNPAQIGALALKHQVVLNLLQPRQASLEDAFLQLTDQSVEFRAQPLPVNDNLLAGAPPAGVTGTPATVAPPPNSAVAASSSTPVHPAPTFNPPAQPWEDSDAN